MPWRPTAPDLDSPPGEAAAPAAFRASDIAAASLPVLVSVPHAGRVYPPALLANLQVPPEAVVRLEDRYVDLLSRAAATAGAAVIIATRPRAWIDLNRAPHEIDPDMLADARAGQFGQPSARVRGGLGLVPRRLASHGELWRRRWSQRDIAARIAADHAPYHNAIGGALARLRDRFGAALLLDLHSMPPLAPVEGIAPPQIVIGDRFGRAAADALSHAAIAAVQAMGYRTALNHPYAGGYVLERHGRPDRGISALQVEIDRSLYLDAALRDPGPGAARLDREIGQLARLLAAEIGGPARAIAAE